MTRNISDVPVSNTEGSPPWRDRGTQAEKASKIVFIKIINTRLGLNMAVHDVGVGIAQLVPVLVSGLANIQTFTEQPELHLHPRLQMQLADFFASTWNLSGHRSIIETHSEYIALRLLRRLRETSRKNIESNKFSIRMEDLAFYYFNPVEGVTEVKKLRVTPAGEFLDRWPKGVFLEREGELFDDID